jgi:integrase
MNNHLIGNWIGRRLRTVLPPWMARVPDTDGRYRASDPPVRVTPYDLRHAWAVAMATDPAWRHVSTEMAAQAMGHDLAVHRRRYQRWIGSEERRRRAMAAVSTPALS